MMIQQITSPFFPQYGHHIFLSTGRLVPVVDVGLDHAWSHRRAATVLAAARGAAVLMLVLPRLEGGVALELPRRHEPLHVQGARDPDLRAVSARVEAPLPDFATV